MRRTLIAVLFLAAGAARLHAGEAEGRLQQGDYVAVLGDSMPVVYGQAPIAPQLYSNIIEAYLLMCKQSAGAATAAVRPVRHTIKIEAMK